MKKRRIFVLSGAFLILVAVSLAYFGTRHAGEEILTVSQLKARGDKVAQEEVKVTGRVKVGSIRWDNQNQLLRFVLADMQNELEVIYQGVVSKDLKPGAEVKVSGRYDTTGILRAQTLGRKSSALCGTCH